MASDRDKEAPNRRGRLLKTSNYVFVRADTAEREGGAATRLGFGVRRRTTHIFAKQEVIDERKHIVDILGSSEFE